MSSRQRGRPRRFVAYLAWEVSGANPDAVLGTGLVRFNGKVHEIGEELDIDAFSEEEARAEAERSLEDYQPGAVIVALEEKVGLYM